MNQKNKLIAINSLSILRIVGIPLLFTIDGIARFIFVNILFITDFLDGYFARKYNLETKLGGFLDLIGDKALVSVLMIYYGLSDWTLMIIAILIIIREIISMVLRFAQLSGENRIIAPSFAGKLKTTLQFIAIDALLLGLPAIIYLPMFIIIVGIGYYSLYTYFVRARSKNE